MTASKIPPPRRKLPPSTTLLAQRQPPYGDIPETLKIPRHCKWLSGDVGLIQKWVHDMILHVEGNPRRFRPIIQDLQKVIETDPALYMIFITMFKEILAKYKHSNSWSSRLEMEESPELYAHVRAVQLYPHHGTGFQ